MKKKIKEAEERLESASKKERQLNNLKERLIREQKDKLNELEKRYQDSLKLLKEALKKSENPDARRLINKAYDNKKDIKIEEEKKEIELRLERELNIEEKRRANKFLNQIQEGKGIIFYWKPGWIGLLRFKGSQKTSFKERRI